MTDQDGRLARHVAEAADAWLRDPLDAGVYRRLVDATLAWRAGGGRVVQGLPEPGAVPGASPGVEPTAPPRPAAVTPDDDERYLRPDRAPRAVGSTLADVASLLRARAGAARADPAPDATASATHADTHTGPHQDPGTPGRTHPTDTSPEDAEHA